MTVGPAARASMAHGDDDEGEGEDRTHHFFSPFVPSTGCLRSLDGDEEGPAEALAVGVHEPGLEPGRGRPAASP